MEKLKSDLSSSKDFDIQKAFDAIAMLGNSSDYIDSYTLSKYMRTMGHPPV